MYRKVHNTMLALSASGVLLLAGLMAGQPTPLAPDPLVKLVQVGPLSLRVESPHGSSPAAAAQVGARASELVASASAAEAVSRAASLAAALAVERAFLASLDDVEADADAARQRGDVQRRHVRRAREALALPYFSFAQGLRRNRS